MPATTTKTPTCSRCGNDPEAPCHGSPGCHGFWEGCDCPRCARDYKLMKQGKGYPADPNRPRPL
jgi:hypothetical protein